MKRFFVLLILVAAPALAHEMHAGYLEIEQTSAGSATLRWTPPVSAGSLAPVNLEFPAGWTLDETQPPVQVSTELSLQTVHLGDSGFSNVLVAFPGLEQGSANTFVRVEELNGRVSTYFATPYQPWVELKAGENRWAKARDYLWLGMHHILMGPDHLLFVLGLLLLVSSRGMLFKTITAFTLAHSLTLILATLGIAAIPLGPLNACIALSIFFLGPEIVRAWRGESSLTIRHPWAIAFAFGLLHGFGFASGLSTTGLATSELLTALLLFNLGVEAGQLLFLALVFLMLLSWYVIEMQWPRWLKRAPGYAVGILGAYWTIDRTLAMVLGG